QPGKEVRKGSARRIASGPSQRGGRCGSVGARQHEPTSSGLRLTRSPAALARSPFGPCQVGITARRKKMYRKSWVAGLAAIAVAALVGAAQPAEARSHHHGAGGWAPHFAKAPPFAFRHFRHHRRFAFVGVYGYPYYYDDYYEGCYWLRRRALYTGSAYWWHRYYACRHGYY